jgi:hypothetical protein
MAWGDTYLPAEDGPPITWHHTTCGQATHPQLTCDVCLEAVTSRNTTARRGPARQVTDQPGR